MSIIKVLVNGLIFFTFSVLFSFAHSIEISENGFWIGEDPEWHVTDWKLAYGILAFLQQENAESVVDFGCGEGDYARLFWEHGLDSEGYDGNPETPTISKGFATVQDLSVPFYLGRTFDWVVCLEVGEHLPHQLREY